MELKFAINVGLSRIGTKVTCRGMKRLFTVAFTHWAAFTPARRIDDSQPDHVY